jgi:hypothetical protein
MCVLYFFYGFLFSSGADFFRKETNGRSCFFDRPFCSSKECWALRLRVIELRARAMACNWSSAMGMNGGFIRRPIWLDSLAEPASCRSCRRLRSFCSGLKEDYL